MMCRCEPLHSSGYGHMADGIRPEPAVHRTAGSRDFDDPLSSVKSPPGPPDDHWWSGGPAHAWPTRSAGSRENPVADIGVSPWTGAELCRQAVWLLHLRYHAGGVRRQAAPAGPSVVCRMQRPATDEPRPPAGRCGAAAAPVSADLSLTCDVPAVD